ncbi:MAG: TolC family protein [Methyloprofundus sp.]|nr:TolC family protein [Methyloprofundus sp.]
MLARQVTFIVILCVTSFAKADILHLSSALKIAVQENPNLAQMQARYSAMSTISAQVSSLPDPVISFNALNMPVDSFDLAQENMTQMQGGISQSIPFFGKLSLSAETADYQAEAAKYDVTELRLRLLSHVKQNWWMLFYLHRSLNIIHLNQNLLRQFINIARTKYEVGEGLQQDVLLAQLELSKLLDKQIKTEAILKKYQAQLNALLSRPANQLIQLPKIVPETLAPLKNETLLYSAAENTRALLSSRRENIHAAQSRLKLAKKDLLPDFKVGVFYGGRVDNTLGQTRADLLSVKVSMTVPIFAASKQQKAIDQYNSELIQQRYLLKEQWNQTRADISSAYSEYQQHQQQAVLFKQGIIPQAKQTVASMLAGYQVNKVDFLNLVRSQVTLYNYEIQYWQTLSLAKQAAAQLIAIIGKEEIYE